MTAKERIKTQDKLISSLRKNISELIYKNLSTFQKLTNKRTTH